MRLPSLRHQAPGRVRTSIFCKVSNCDLCLGRFKRRIKKIQFCFCVKRIFGLYPLFSISASRSIISLLGETSFEHDISRSNGTAIVIRDKFLFAVIFLCLFFSRLVSKFDNNISNFTLFKISGLSTTYRVLFFKWSYPCGKRLYP